MPELLAALDAFMQAPTLCAACLDLRLSGSNAPRRVVLLDRSSPVLDHLIETRKNDLLRLLRGRL
jgi:hypothetical protein